MNILSRFVHGYRKTYLRPVPLVKFIKLNFLRKNTQRVQRDNYIVPTLYSVFDLHTTARLNIGGTLIVGLKKYNGSRLETSIWMDKEASMSSDGGSIYHGCDIQIFNKAALHLGKGIIMNRGVQIICQEEITIGDGCLISRDVVIRDNDGGHNILTEGYKKSSPVHIGNHVWIGQGATILKGVTIGEGAIIGAGSIVMTNVKPKAMVMADPARTFAKDIEWEA